MKVKKIVCILPNLKVFFLVFALDLGIMQNRNSLEWVKIKSLKCGRVIVLENNGGSTMVKKLFYLFKIFNIKFTFQVVCNANDSPGIVSSSKQQAYWSIIIFLQFY